MNHNNDCFLTMEPALNLKSDKSFHKCGVVVLRLLKRTSDNVGTMFLLIIQGPVDFKEESVSLLFASYFQYGMRHLSIVAFP